MMKKKLYRDFKKHFGQFASVFLLAFLAVCLFTGLQGEIVSVQVAREKYHAETNLADYWIYGETFSKEQVNQIEKIEQVTTVQGRYYAQVKGKKDSTVFLYFQDTDTVNQPMILDGKAYDTEDTEHIWLCERFAKEQGLEIGERYSFCMGDREYSLEIAGFVWSPEYEYYKDEVDLEPDYADTGYGFASIKVLPENARIYNQIVLKSSEGKLSDLEDNISEIVDGNYSVMLDREGITNLTVVDDEIAQHQMLAFLFPTFFVAIAMLTTITTMKRIVDRQRTQIGTLKAIGMKNKKIYFHYLSYGFYPSLAGSVLGAIVGPITLSPLLFKMKYYLDSSDEYMLPHFPVKYSFTYLLLVLLIVTLCTTVTWLSCRKILKIAPATALRPAQPKSAKKIVFEKLPFWSSLSFSNRYNLRDISRNKARTVFGLAGTISCMALLLCGFASRDNFKTAVSDLYVNKLMNQSNMITLEANTPIAEAEDIRNQVNGELVMSDTVEIRLPGQNKKKSYHMNVYEDSHIANALNENLQVIQLNQDDFTITKKTAESLGVQVGDTIEWHLYGSSQWIASKITKITRAPFEQGIVTTRSVLENAGYSFTPTRLLTRDEVEENLEDTSEYISSVTTKNKMADMLANYMELINLCMGFMIVFAIFLVIIVLYSLGLLSFEERQKEMATLKVLGFGTKKLRKLMLQQNIILAIIGVLLGIPLGSWMLSILVNSLGDSMDVPTSCKMGYILLSLTITLILSIVVNVLFSKKIRSMDMVMEIKSAE